MKKIKICYVTDTWFPIIGGGPQVLHYYAKILSSNYNYQVDIITRRLKSKHSLNPKIANNINVIKMGRMSSWNNPFSRLVFIWQVFIYLMNNKYDIIHAFPFIAGLPCILIKLITNTPVVYSFFSFSRNFFVVMIEFFFFILPYNLLITDNYKIYRKFRNWRKIAYLVNGVDAHLFDKVKKVKKTNQIIYVGRFHKQKGIDILLKVFYEIRKRHKKVRLVMVGYGNEIKKIKDFISRNDLMKYIIIKPPLLGQALVKEYKKSLFLILPSLFEGQGIVVFEAWMSKIPVMASNSGSLIKFVKNNVNGFLVDVGDINKMVYRGVSLIENNKKRKRMGLAGYNLVKQNYTWDMAVKNLNQHYLKLSR